jgi:hypothetical protein
MRYSDKLLPGRRFSGVAVLLAVLAGPLLAQGSRVAQQPEVKVDYATARREIVGFESILNKAIAPTFVSSPFGLVQKPKGVYLPGYGVTFTLLINVHRVVVDTPFGQIKRGEINPELKKKIVEDIKDQLIRTILENGASLSQVRKEDSVTVVAFVEDQNFPDEPNQNKTIVLSVLKRDFESNSGKDRQRIKILEY